MLIHESMKTQPINNIKPSECPRHPDGLELETLNEFCERSRTEERLKKDFERAAKNILNGWPA